MCHINDIKYISILICIDFQRKTEAIDNHQQCVSCGLKQLADVPRELTPFCKVLCHAKKNKFDRILHIYKKCLGEMLNAAAAAGDIHCVHHLLEAGANTNFQDENYHGNATTAFHSYLGDMYMMCSHTMIDPDDVLEHLCSHSEECDDCLTQLTAADRYDVLGLVYKHSLRVSYTPLMSAIANKQDLCIQPLLEAGSSVQTDCGIYHGWNHVTPIARVILDSNSQALQLLVENGVDVNVSLRNAIVRKADEDCLTILLNAGIYAKLLKVDEPNAILAIAAGGNGPDIPVSQREVKPYSLKYTCRFIIRKQLLACNKTNLFKTATYMSLKLPLSLCRYIVCEQAIN